MNYTRRTEKPSVADVLVREDPGFETARRATVWNQRKPARSPEMIVRAATVRDVIETVHHARSTGMPISVRGSGHSYAASFLKEGGILLDVSALTDVEVEGDVARVRPGVRSAELARILGEHGRAFPAGHNATVGIGGFLLGGGMGYNGESWGQFACFRVRAVDVVTASGELVTASETSHPDLFWAARGAGPAFPGVAVRFELATAPAPAGMHLLRATYPVAAARDVAAWLQDLADRGDPDLEYFTSVETVDRDGRPETLCLVRVVAFHVDAHAARNAVEQVAAAAPGGADESVIHPVTYQRLYEASITGEQLHIVNDTIWTGDGVEATTRLADLVSVAPTPKCLAMMNFRARPGPLPDGAASVIDSTFLSWSGAWSDPGDEVVTLGWFDGVVDALEPYRTGCYINETDIGRHPQRAAYCYSPQALARLGTVRAEYDPDLLFPPAF